MPERQSHSPLEVLRVFLKLGLTSFGGPVAHIGYFRQEFVARRGWLDEAAFSDLVALCQFLPGPASSQVGFSIGLIRAGYLGGLAAWTAFTLPSAIALVLFAYGAHLLDGPAGLGLLHGLKLAAVAIVAQAVWGMAQTLCPDRRRVSIALIAVLAVLLIPSAVSQIAAILLGAAAGIWLCRMPSPASNGVSVVAVSRTAGIAALAIFVLLLVGLPLLRRHGSSQGLALFDAFYRSGALVFGGGHVVLPLLRASLVPAGWLSDDVFLTGYGVAQSVPGPLFSLAAYLGAATSPGWASALARGGLCLCAIFLPGLLIAIAAAGAWTTFARIAVAQRALGGVSAAVVGILAAALYDPVWSTAVRNGPDAVIAVVAAILLGRFAVPPIVVVAGCVIVSAWPG
jgi:chromate transporter